MRQFDRSCCFVALVSVVALLCGCAPEVLPAQSHSPSDPESVKLYQKAPAKYEKLGMVETTQNVKFQADATVDPAVDSLKAQAATMGANGLLLQVDADQNGQKPVLATGMYHGQSYQFPVKAKPVKTAMATAIYVVKE